jgi:hypothetical protein
MKWHICIAPMVLLAAATETVQCGPTEVEAGRAVIISAPVALLAGLGMMRLLLWLWRKLRPELTISYKPMLVALGISVVGAVLALTGIRAGEPGTPSGLRGILDLVPIAIWAVGTTYLLFVLIFWRVLLAIGVRQAFSWALVPPLILLFLPALPMAFGVTSDWLDSVMLVWMSPGYGGAVTGPVLVVAIIEVLVRWRMTRSSRASNREDDP